MAHLLSYLLCTTEFQYQKLLPQVIYTSKRWLLFCVCVSLSCLKIQLETTVLVPLSIDEKFQRVDLVIEII